MAKRKSLQKKTKARIMGYSIMALAALGVVFLVFLGTKGVQKLLDDSPQRTEFQQFIEPVVMLDPVTFEDPNELPDDFLLQASLWAVLKNEDTARYSVDNNGQTMVPVADVDKYGASLFGPSVELKHQTFTDIDLTFAYDSEKQVYILPATGLLGYYTPLVSEMKKSGDTITLSVGYISASAGWTGDADGNVYKPEPSKHMLYILTKQEDGSYVITAVREDPYYQTTAPPEPSTSGEDATPPDGNNNDNKENDGPDTDSGA